MGSGEHDHHHKVKIPDYRIYKVEDVPELVQVKSKLSNIGLKDPWLRNEVWRFHPSLGTRKERINLLVFRGFKYGFGLFVATILAEKAYEYASPSSSHDHH
ncbi:NADH dehydrogenase [ubiquinone] 1 beta subcomplex subunit 3 [Lycorma delicatula]|uniref:NADH dehydrogenase [ubiquinone] 1 beta subcomplex subunit 3 n=1 Tax=Lycorma delicatula TaxID=130591 RepID=UPI003F514E23